MQTIFKQGFKKVLIEEIITKLIDDLFTKRDSINTEVQSKVEVMVKDLILKLLNSILKFLGIILPFLGAL